MRNRSLNRAFALLPMMCVLISCEKVAPKELSLDNCPQLSTAAGPTDSEAVYVIKVIDSDTFTACVPSLGGSIKIRVLGIDCPESRRNPKCKADAKRGKEGCDEQIPKGKFATTLAKDILLGQKVYLESPRSDGVFKKDIYKRWLAYVRTDDGQDFGKLMVSNKICENYNWKYPHPRGGEYGSL